MNRPSTQDNKQEQKKREARASKRNNETAPLNHQLNDLITNTEGNGTLTILHALQQLLIQKNFPLFLQIDAGPSQ